MSVEDNFLKKLFEIRRKFVKKIFTTGILMLSAALPFTLQAQTLHLENHTDQDSTTFINGKCSTYYLGKAGVTPKHGDRNVPEWQVKLACRASDPNPCKGDVYMTNNCTGPIVAHGEFSPDKGVNNLVVLTPDKYKINVVSPFFIAMYPA